MKTVSAGFRTMLRTSTSLLRCDLFTFTLKDATVIRYTNAPQNIVIGGNTYLAASEFNTVPSLRRGGMRMAVGLAVDALDIDMIYQDTTRILSKTPGAFANGRGFDGTRVVIDVLMTPDFADTSRGVVNMFTGVVSEVEVDSTRVRMRCAADMVFLNAAFPPCLYQPNCNNALFDARCGLLKSAYANNDSAVAGGTQTTVIASAAGVVQGKVADYFALGYIVITSGTNNGLIRSVKKSTGATLALLYPLPVALAAGDTFTAYPGCNKSEAACDSFGNRARFRGFPFLPQPETTQLGGTGATDNTGSGAGNGPGGIGSGSGGTGFKLQ